MTWENVNLHVNFAVAPVPVPVFSVDSVRFNGLRVVDWFLRELMTKHTDKKEGEEATLWLTFDQIRAIEIDGRPYDVSHVGCTATRARRNKRKWMRWSGDALYDWHTQTFTIPSGGSVIGGFVEMDFTAWDDFNGDMPEKIGFCRVEMHVELGWNDSIAVPDLMSL